ncbi:MAG: FecR domain-containing protein [Gemmatimonadaceae bacterium]|nr:FecR domain-containing protein [Gemmatimonadaceae bacterium]
MTHDRDELDDVDPAVLARYLSGEGTREDREVIQRWVGADLARRQRLETLRARWSEAAAQRPRFDIDGMWARVDRATRETPPLVLRPAHTTPRAAPRLWVEASGARWRPAVGAIAAALLVTAGAVLWRAAARPAPDAAAPMREIATTKGQRTRILLRDGTRVELSVDSKLRYANAFGEKTRDVYLEGEGYFEVVHDAKHPFIVHANGARAEDIGTEFGVRAYPGDTAVQVVVQSGRVSLQPANASGAAPVLGAGELGRVSANSATVTVQRVDPAAYLAWRTGTLVFDNATLADVVAQLRHWYDVRLELGDPSLAGKRLTASFHDDSLAEVLRTIAVTLDLRAEQRNGAVTLMPNDSR